MDRRSLLDRAAKSAEERVLLGHILDKYDQCRQRNLPTNTAFLSPAEAQGARDLLRAAAIHEGFALLGGYEGAERRMLFFLPDWQEEADASDAMAFLRAAWHESEHPTHRDLLGSLMWLITFRIIWHATVQLSITCLSATIRLISVITWKNSSAE